MRARTTLAIKNTTRGEEPRVPYGAIKHAILGSTYELSLAFVGETRARALNKTYRGVDKPGTVLSFPLETRAGEIIICLPYAKRRANAFGLSYRDFVGYLFIHGALHLKGLDHGSRMNERERSLCERFSLAYPTT